MKNSIWIVITIGLALATVLSMGFHLIRTEDGFDLITKEVLTFDQTYADVREWGPTDYLSSAPRIRSHLFSIRYRGMMEAADGHAQGLKARIRDAEHSLHQWVSEKLE